MFCVVLYSILSSVLSSFQSLYYRHHHCSVINCGTVRTGPRRSGTTNRTAIGTGMMAPIENNTGETELYNNKNIKIELTDTMMI